MTNKRIKNEQWSVKQLISKIDNKEITKPKFQRKKKWDNQPNKNDSNTNEKSYIKFLYETENSVHAITFGQESNGSRIIYSNIDGNNRINAIKHFIEKPFEIFKDYLNDLFNILDTIDIVVDKMIAIKHIFKSLSYKDIINIKTPSKYFRSINKAELFKEIQSKQNDIDDEIEKIQELLKINKTDRFDESVKINVNLFEGYSTDELCKTFEDINKYNSKLTETELLACRLYNNNNFIITDKTFETSLKTSIKEYYKDKSDREVLDCYVFDDTHNINAHDFIVGFQNLFSKEYDFIGKTDVDGLSLFFKLWKAYKKDFDKSFTTENVNDFIEKITYSCKILQETITNIFTDRISSKLFNNSCQEKLKTLKKNNVLMLLSSIFGFKEQNEDKTKIIKHLEKCLIYHFFVSDLSKKYINLHDKNRKESFKNKDTIQHMAGGGYIENINKLYITNPEIISSTLDKKLFNDLLKELYIETNTPYERKLKGGRVNNGKRRKLKFFEKTLMFYYYKQKMPTNLLERTFSIEHIVPNSCFWEGKLDKDRTGNLIPIISTINSQRGNRHIDAYKYTEDGQEFFKYIRDIIPETNLYDQIIKHDSGKPIIIDIIKYDTMCTKNEEIYQDNFINCLFN